MHKRLLLLFFVLFIWRNAFALNAHADKSASPAIDNRTALRYQAMEREMNRLMQQQKRLINKKALKFMLNRDRAMEEAINKILRKRRQIMQEVIDGLAEKAKQRFFFMVGLVFLLYRLKKSPITAL